MNPLLIFASLIGMKKSEHDEFITCPSCGKQQRPPGDLKFHCSECQYRIPSISVERDAHALRWMTPSFFYEVALVILGPILALIGLKGFLIPNGLIDGGVTGISMLCSRVFKLDLAFFLVLINIPFIYSSYRFFNREFAFKASFCILLLSVLLPFVEIPNFTQDRMLDSVFGGFFLGAGIALSIRGGGVLDGTEILALIISRRFPATVGDSILIFNVLIFSSALLVLPPEQVLYSILTYFSASKTVDFMMHGIESYNGVFVISNQSHQIRFSLVNELGRGATIIKSRGGYSERDQEILFCVLTRLEISSMRRLIEKSDKTAFVVVFPISDVQGGMVKKILFEKHI